MHRDAQPRHAAARAGRCRLRRAEPTAGRQPTRRRWSVRRCDRHPQTVQRIVKRDLTRQPRSLGPVIRAIKEIVLIGAHGRCFSACEIDINVARRARAASAAQCLEFTCALITNDLHDGPAGFRVNLTFLTLTGDDRYLGHHILSWWLDPPPSRGNAALRERGRPLVPRMARWWLPGQLDLVRASLPAAMNGPASRQPDAVAVTTIIHRDCRSMVSETRLDAKMPVAQAADGEERN